MVPAPSASWSLRDAGYVEDPTDRSSDLFHGAPDFSFHVFFVVWARWRSVGDSASAADMAHHHHSHAEDISEAERELIKAFAASENTRGDAWLKQAEQILGELAFYSTNVHSQLGLWSMGELDRFITEHMPGHVGDPVLTKAAPEVVSAFSEWLLRSGKQPKTDVAAIQKRLRKIANR